MRTADACHRPTDALSDQHCRYSPPTPAMDRHEIRGGNMARPRAADDFVAIRARLEELRRERSPAAREDPVEPSDKTYFYSRSRSPAQIADQALQRAVARGRFPR